MYDVTSRDTSVCTYEGTNYRVVVTFCSYHNFLYSYESKLYWPAGSKGLLHTTLKQGNSGINLDFFIKKML